jgi:hypothetical protein
VCTPGGGFEGVIAVGEADDAKLVRGSVRCFSIESAQRGDEVLVKLDKDSEDLACLLAPVLCRTAHRGGG